tara:strand:- start:61 stop:729 length:669 start_codon:yes stop_codon:yes gene_type:complete
VNTELYQLFEALHGQLESVDAKLIFRNHTTKIYQSIQHDNNILSMDIPAETEIDFEMPEGEMNHHCFETIEDICQITTPNSILEIGFRRGNSALMWLINSSATLMSLDIDDFSIKSVQLLESQFPNRFKYLQCDSRIFKSEETFDLIFIDGDHSVDGIESDIKMSLQLNPKYLVLDDYFHGDHHQDMYKLISQFDLEIMKEYKTHQGQVLIKNKLRKERNAI